MDKQRRGELLVEQEEVDTTIARLRKDLAQSGKQLSRLGQTLNSKPEVVVFANAPDGLGDYDPGLIGRGETFPWEEFNGVTVVAQKILELRNLLRRQMSIKRELGQ